jgi:hypothetical protein
MRNVSSYGDTNSIKTTKMNITFTKIYKITRQICSQWRNTQTKDWMPEIQKPFFSSAFILRQRHPPWTDNWQCFWSR